MSSYETILVAAVESPQFNLDTRFYVNFQGRLQEHEFAEKVFFFLKRLPFMYLQRRNATMYMHGGTQNAREFVEHIHDSPTVNGFCAVFFLSKVYGPFFC